jgi:hypothetical protein
MLLSQWLQQLAQRWSAPGRNRHRAVRAPALPRRRVRPRLEALEDRCLLSNISIVFPVITYGQATTTISGSVIGDSGQQVPVGETVAITLNGVTQDAAIGNSDDFSTNLDTGKLNVSGAPYKISAFYAGDAHNSSASANGFLGVVAAIPSLTNLSLSSRVITYGTTATIIISGHLRSGSAQTVPTGEVITIGGIGIPQTTTTLDGNDDFTCTLDTHAVPAGPMLPVLLKYGGDGNFVGVIDSSLKLSVNPATPSFSNLDAPTIPAGTPATAITGHLNSNAGLHLVPAGETVIVTVNGVPQIGVLNANDDFLAILDTSQLSASHPPYTITVAYAGDGNFTSTSASSTLTVTSVGAPSQPPTTLSDVQAAWHTAITAVQDFLSDVVDVALGKGGSANILADFARVDYGAQAVENSVEELPVGPQHVAIDLALFAIGDVMVTVGEAVPVLGFPLAKLGEDLSEFGAQDEIKVALDFFTEQLTPPVSPSHQ